MKRTPSRDLIGSQVRIYRNLHQECWSIQQKGKVVGHALTVELKNVRFKVLKGGYSRFQREQKKNVHAFVVGELVGFNGELWTIGGTEVTYNPRKAPVFHTILPLFKGREYYFSEYEEIKRAFCAEKTIWTSNREEEP